jgi:VanZ family protein
MDIETTAHSATGESSQINHWSDWSLVALWVLLNFILSTSYFSAAATAGLVEPVLRFLLPFADASTIETLHLLIRKLAHFTEYAVLFWLLARKPMRDRPVQALLICAMLALMDEGHQLFVPSRTASLLDVGLDFSGALFANFVRAGIVAALS